MGVPIVTVVVSEGGSGGALAIAMGNKIGMLSGAWYSTISPEGAASILGRYKDEAHKKDQFPKDCVTIANMQNVYAPQLKKLGIIDDVIWEGENETFENFPTTRNNLLAFLESSLDEMQALGAEKLIAQRYEKFRA